VVSSPPVAFLFLGGLLWWFLLANGLIFGGLLYFVWSSFLRQSYFPRGLYPWRSFVVFSHLIISSNCTDINIANNGRASHGPWRCDASLLVYVQHYMPETL